MEYNLYISSYFKIDRERLTPNEQKRKKRIRDEINSFKDEYDCIQYIYNRRYNKRFNREEDLKLFSIPLDAEIDLPRHHRDNRYYNGLEGLVKNQNGGFNLDKYGKKDRYGNQRYDRKGNPLVRNKLERGGINFANNVKNSKLSRNVRFIATHITLIAHLAFWIAVIIAAIVALIYITGTLGSIGHTPFALCTDEEINAANSSSSSSAAVSIDEAASSKYSIDAFITLAKEYGWKDEAIVGTVSYILQEGGGMGTFTYESYYVSRGPSEIYYDKTLDNDAWLEWINGIWNYDTEKYDSLDEAIVANDYEHIPGDGEVRAHEIYSKQYRSSHYAAIGIGLFQDSDVWSDVDTKTANNATNLINWCDAQGKSWQDPETQLRYYFEHKLNDPSAFDGANPTTDQHSAEEWCKRVCAGIGMPAWHWNDSHTDYYNAHTAHLQEANACLKNATGVSLLSLDDSKMNLCKRDQSIVFRGNSSIADAAVTLAATDVEKITVSDDPNMEDPRLHNYKSIKDQIFAGDSIYASCDRSAATAIRWSGSDDSFPRGDTGAIWTYLNGVGTAKWKRIGTYGKCELQAGDILITQGSGHIKIYIGTEAAQKKFPGSTSDMYAGSYSANDREARYPRLYKDSPSYDSRQYIVFRCFNPDNSSTYSELTID